MLGGWSGWRVGGVKPLRRLNDKTVLGRLRPGEILRATQGDTLLTVFVVFDEAALGISNEEVIDTLRKFAERVSEVIKLFDS